MERQGLSLEEVERGMREMGGRGSDSDSEASSTHNVTVQVLKAPLTNAEMYDIMMKKDETIAEKEATICSLRAKLHLARDKWNDAEEDLNVSYRAQLNVVYFPL